MMRLFRTLSEYPDTEKKIQLPDWVSDSCKKFISTITSNNPDFPCFFAKATHFNRDLYFTYIESNEIDAPNTFIDVLKGYLNELKKTNSYTALVVFIDISLKNETLDFYEAIFWSLLQFIHNNDSKAWPQNSPKDPEDLDWKFYYQDVALFINAHCSKFIKRKSRFSHSDIMLIIQPYENIDRIRGHSGSVQAISNKIRMLVENYDSMPISSVFGKNFSDSNTHNWKQFWLVESDEPQNKKCPLKII